MVSDIQPENMTHEEYVEEMFRLRREGLQAALKAHDRQETISAWFWAAGWISFIGLLLWGASTQNITMFLGGIVGIIVMFMVSTNE